MISVMICMGIIGGLPPCGLAPWPGHSLGAVEHLGQDHGLNSHQRLPLFAWYAVGFGMIPEAFWLYTFFLDVLGTTCILVC